MKMIILVGAGRMGGALLQGWLSVLDKRGFVAQMG